MLNVPGFVSVLRHVFQVAMDLPVNWCGGWDSNPRRPTPQDFSCEPDLKSSPVRSRERSCPFDLNPATIGPGPMHGLGNPRIQHAPLFDALNDHSHQRAIYGKLAVVQWTCRRIVFSR